MSNPKVQIVTNFGNITLELFADKAPVTVENFLRYVQSGHYKSTIFHRVIKGFMIQGGGFTTDFVQKDTFEPIVNEATNMLSNDFGTIAMARTAIVNSATCQFFINSNNNTFLNHTAPTMQGFGYCVFGKTIEGEEVIRKIESVKTTRYQGHSDVPVDKVVIEDVIVL